MRKFSSIEWTAGSFNRIQGDCYPNSSRADLARAFSMPASRRPQMELFGGRVVLGWTAFRKKLIAASLPASKFSSDDTCPPRTTGRPDVRSSR